jgi:hypothetical protein
MDPVILLLSLLAAAGVLAYVGWISAQDAVVPASGYVAMALGVIFSLGVGFGLMALIFYRSRKGFDEPPVLIVPDDVFEKAEIDPKIAREAG